MSTLHDAIRAEVRAALRGLNVGLPGRLEKYDAATGRGQVKPLILEPDTAGVLKPLPVIPGVPVVFPGGNAAALYLPPEIGDTGWLSFSHRSMEIWLERGGDCDPGDPRVMDLTDAVFWPGLRPFTTGSLAEEADAAVLRNGSAKLKLRGGKVALGNNQAELLDLMDQMLTKIQTIVTTPAVVSSPSALSPTAIADFALIQVKLSLIRGTL